MNKEKLYQWAEKNQGRLPIERLNQKFLYSMRKEEMVFAELYLLLGADPNANENQAMKLEVERCNLENIKILYQYGGSLSYLCLTNLVESNCIHIMSFMLENGARMKKKYLKVAVKAKLPEMVKLLLNYYKEAIDTELIQLAMETSLEMVDIFLPRVGGIFPEDTLRNENSFWGCFANMPCETLSMILIKIEKEDKVVSEILKEGHWDRKSIKEGKWPKEFIFRLKCALQAATRKADYNKICFLLEYLKGKGVKEFSKVFTINEWKGLLSAENPIKEVNAILDFFEGHDIQPNEEQRANVKKTVCKRGSARTLEFFGFEIDEDLLAFAITGKNQSLIEDLLSMEIIKPSREHIEMAMNMWQKEKDDTMYRILYMLVKFHDF